MARFKPSMKDRQDEAIEQNKYPIMDKNNICKIIKKALAERSIQGNILTLKPQDIDYEKIKEENGTNDSSHILFIQFTQKGHVAVVGAGKDISFSKKKAYGTWRIISSIKDVEWDYETVIVIPILNIKNCAIEKGDSILAYRNGVEHYLGDYLFQNKVPILNCYQHKNYSDEFWDKCKKNDYII
jgi:hypothetical protein